MGFLTALRWMIIIVIIVLTMFVGRIIVFEHLEVFLKGLPPTQLWHPIMRLVLSVINSMFHWILLFLVIMYIIYLLIKMFVPNIWPFLPLKNIFLSITPLYELRRAGVFGLFDAVVNLIFSSDPFLIRILKVGQAFGRFLAGPAILLRENGKQVVVGKDMSMDMDTNNLLKPEKGEDSFQDDTEGEPTYEETVSPAENRYIQKEYQQCISESYIVPTNDMSDEEKSTVDIRNNASKIICDVKKIQSYGTLMSSKFL